jgi:CheY-like chemotaxis protein
MVNKILCIDDDPVSLMLCQLINTKTDFAKEVETVMNGTEALDYYSNLLKSPPVEKNINYPRLIILDLIMPIMNGWEFLEKFKPLAFSEFQETKVLILASSIEADDMEKMKDFPFVIHLLSKPLTIEILEDLKIQMS